MQGRKNILPKLMYQVSLPDLVPENNFYRQLNSCLNLSFLYKETAKYYGSEGQESIDPVVFFKICLVGYLNNITSDRKLIQYCSNCLDVRLYLQYDIDEDLPWHSTISRTRKLYGEEVFLALFQQILSMCVQKGMVKGKRQAIDSAFIKANASLDSVLEKEILEDAMTYANELDQESEFQIKSTSGQPVGTDEPSDKVKPLGNIVEKDEHGKLIRPKHLSNESFYSPTDPDARISVKSGKPRQLNYYGQIAVDDANHVITGATADFADKRDSHCLEKILQQAIDNLKQEDIVIEQVCADTGYSSGAALHFAEQNNIEAYIPNRAQYKPTREGFIYNAALDQWECQQGNKAILNFKGVRLDGKGNENKQYRSSETVCKNCPLRQKCLTKSTKSKTIYESVDKPYYDKMHVRMQTSYASQMRKIRSKTVEPVLGTLLTFLSMRRVNARGIKQATKHVIMAALSYNLKKYLRFRNKKPKLVKTGKVERDFQKLHLLILNKQLLSLLKLPKQFSINTINFA